MSQPVSRCFGCVMWLLPPMLRVPVQGAYRVDRDHQLGSRPALVGLLVAGEFAIEVPLGHDDFDYALTVGASVLFGHRTIPGEVGKAVTGLTLELGRLEAVV